MDCLLKSISENECKNIGNDTLINKMNGLLGGSRRYCEYGSMWLKYFYLTFSLVRLDYKRIS